MDGVGGVPDQDLGVVVGGEPVDRLVLREAGQNRRVRPGGLVEDAVHLDFCHQLGDGHVQLTQRSAVDLVFVDGPGGVGRSRRAEGSRRGAERSTGHLEQCQQRYEHQRAPIGLRRGAGHPPTACAIRQTRNVAHEPEPVRENFAGSANVLATTPPLDLLSTPVENVTVIGVNPRGWTVGVGWIDRLRKLSQP